MPHLTLEYSANIAPPSDLKPVFLSLHKVLNEIGGISLGNCKSPKLAIAIAANG
ncbi:MAG: hypothetical protein AAF420_12240 [Pseudomonadota bacterium]